MILVKNFKVFHLFMVGQIGQENVFDGILKKIKSFLDYYTETLKSEKILIFPKALVLGFGQQFQCFCIFFIILGKIGQEKVLDDVLQRKKNVSRL